MKKLLPVILVVLGLAGGLGVGKFLQPQPEPKPDGELAECSADEGEACDKPEKPVLYVEEEEVFDPEKATEFAKMSKQFVVPVVKKDRVRAMVVMSLTLEVETGTTDAIFQREPKLRDGFLQVMFEHANTGGFDGAFTTGESMRDLRGALMEVARKSVGEAVHDVLITELVKQAI